jgi:uncharacterized membrane protein required for colicin V production/uncharacterized protein YkwD
MNAIDIGILIIVGLFAIAGLRRGFLLGLLDLVALVLAVVIGGQFAVTLGEQLLRLGISRQLANGAGFVIAAVISLAVIGFVGRILLSPIRALSGNTAIGWANSVLGLLPGALRGLAVAALLASFLLWLSQEFGEQMTIEMSPFAVSVASAGRDALDSGLEWAGIDVAQIFAPDAPPSSEVTPVPPVAITATERDLAAEEALLALINSDRANAGIAPLRADSTLAEVARLRGEEALSTGGQSATPPQSGSLSAQLAAAGFNSPLVGENTTVAATAELAHTAFMSTPADRANIFNAGFSRVGIAVLRQDSGELIVTEIFAG